MDQVFQRSFHNPEPFRIDPATLPPAAQAIAAGNRAAISVYAGAAMADPTLLERLGSLEIPTLVLWGRSDGIVDVDYGRAYAAAIPMARFQLLPDTGHSPQLETPDQVIHVIWDSADTDKRGRGRHPQRGPWPRNGMSAAAALRRTGNTRVGDRTSSPLR
jgi:pimeloyl-ACP methyl ester carboxylesterase